MRILLVEDDAYQREMLVRLLRRHGAPDVELVEAGSIAEARAAAGPFDIVITDYQLSPTETARALWSHWADVPFIVVSGYERVPDYDGPWLLKPVPAELLLGTIASVLRARHERDS